MNYYIINLQDGPHRPFIFPSKERADAVGRKFSALYASGRVEVEGRTAVWPKSKEALVAALYAGEPLINIVDRGVVTTFPCGVAQHTAAYRESARRWLIAAGFITTDNLPWLMEDAPPDIPKFLVS